MKVLNKLYELISSGAIFDDTYLLNHKTQSRENISFHGAIS